MDTEVKKASDALKAMAKDKLAKYLKNSVFYVTVCPSIKLVSITVTPGLRCLACGGYHAYLEISREELKDIAEGHISDKIDSFYTGQAT